MLDKPCFSCRKLSCLFCRIDSTEPMPPGGWVNHWVGTGYYICMAEPSHNNAQKNDLKYMQPMPDVCPEFEDGPKTIHEAPVVPDIPVS